MKQGDIASYNKGQFLPKVGKNFLMIKAEKAMIVIRSCFPFLGGIKHS